MVLLLPSVLPFFFDHRHINTFATFLHFLHVSLASHFEFVAIFKFRGAFVDGLLQAGD